jgi:hypothetical protein
MCRWADNIKMSVTETGWEDIDWIYLTENMDR